MAGQDARPDGPTHQSTDWPNVFRDLAARNRVVGHRRINCGEVLSGRGLASCDPSVANRRHALWHSGDASPILADGQKKETAIIYGRRELFIGLSASLPFLFENYSFERPDLPENFVKLFRRSGLITLIIFKKKRDCVSLDPKFTQFCRAMPRSSGKLSRQSTVAISF